MHKRMLRAVAVAAFSAALACGSLAAVGEISWTSSPSGSHSRSAQADEISWTLAPEGNRLTSAPAAAGA